MNRRTSKIRQRQDEHVIGVHLGRPPSRGAVAVDAKGLLLFEGLEECVPRKKVARDLQDLAVENGVKGCGIDFNQGQVLWKGQRGSLSSFACHRGARFAHCLFGHKLANAVTHSFFTPEEGFPLVMRMRSLNPKP